MSDVEQALHALVGAELLEIPPALGVVGVFQRKGCGGLILGNEVALVPLV